MSLFDVGRICVKLAGRDAGRRCVVIEKVDVQFVVVDGDVRRKKVNVKHLEPLDRTVELKAGATHEVVKAVFKKLGFSVWDTNPKKVAPRPRHLKKKREAVVEEKKAAKKVVKAVAAEQA